MCRFYLTPLSPTYEAVGFEFIHEAQVDELHNRCIFWKVD